MGKETLGTLGPM